MFMTDSKQLSNQTPAITFFI